MNKLKLLLLFLFLLLNHFSAVASPKSEEMKKSPIHTKQSFLDDLPWLSLSSVDIEKIAQTLANAYQEKKAIINFPYSLTLQQAQEIQEQLIQLLIPYQGDIIGYKAGLTNPKAQEMFKVSEPVLGRLLEQMLLPSGAKVPAKFGAIPMIEGDLMVRVSSEKINQAKTPEETLKYLDAVIPFLELPDLVYDKDVQLNGEKLIAINVGARLGIVGKPVILSVDKLSNIQITLIDESGKVIAQGDSKALLGDPIKSVFWIKETLNNQGKTLKKGDLLSLGSMTPLIPVKPSKTITAKYQGLEANKTTEISVIFEE
ncbi:hydratase [Crocosphaera sp. UHCC 0190]|uniref:2-keto-4-pentenoate hydratase n=1 Tax=Crocosphaera sp. UHCC 0190 TaxID=3110246 RepID=UPI002B1F854B|nr:hydratase [Crocosphaera sp. UHCC 0190]MEA5508613.1 hydratase [Crocosphaera sp. UHCC 0190]